MSVSVLSVVPFRRRLGIRQVRFIPCLVTRLGSLLARVLALTHRLVLLVCAFVIFFLPIFV